MCEYMFVCVPVYGGQKSISVCVSTCVYLCMEVRGQCLCVYYVCEYMFMCVPVCGGQVDVCVSTMYVSTVCVCVCVSEVDVYPRIRDMHHHA